MLIQHNLVKFQKSAKGQLTYNAHISNILTIPQYPKITYCAKVMFGDAAELMVEELLHHGSMTMSAVVASVTNRLLDPALSQADQLDYHDVAKQFVQLVESHLISRCLTDDIMVLPKSKEDDGARLDVEHDDRYDLPVGYAAGIYCKTPCLVVPKKIFTTHPRRKFPPSREGGRESSQNALNLYRMLGTGRGYY